MGKQNTTGSYLTFDLFPHCTCYAVARWSSSQGIMLATEELIFHLHKRVRVELQHRFAKYLANVAG